MGSGLIKNTEPAARQQYVGGWPPEGGELHFDLGEVPTSELAQVKIGEVIGIVETAFSDCPQRYAQARAPVADGPSALVSILSFTSR